mmetsp:Transcript_9587/g.21378  ORF Transcript_9587/g.21378 Transcript_9587/m.21378 type:complete len:253 (+) Transcript_9587:894-1652(+)
MQLEEFLVKRQHAVEPGQKLLGAVVRVYEHGNPIGWSDRPHVVGPGDRSKHRCLLLLVVQGLPCEEARAPFRELNDDRPVDLTCGLEDGIHSAGGGTVDGWDGEALRLGEAEERPCQVPCDHAWLHPRDFPEGVHVGHGRVEDSLRRIVLDAVAVAEPDGILAIDHRCRYIVGATAAPQRSSYHGSAGGLGRRENNALRRANEVHAHRDAGLATLIDRQHCLALPAEPYLILVRMKAADMTIFTCAQQHEVN